MRANVNIENQKTLAKETPLDPCAIVIFGASGDLAHRKLLPALYDLYIAKRLPKRFFVIGISRRSWTDADFRKEVLATLREKNKSQKKAQIEFVENLYSRMVDSADEDSFAKLALGLKQLEKIHKTRGNRMFYLAIPPAACGPVMECLNKEKLLNTPGERQDKAWTRVVFEKPFGSDLDSARKLNKDIHQYLTEEQIYRIDHYLGKETVQNILMFRFANAIFEPIWNRRYIDHIQIMAYETLGIEHRAEYYDKAGALRDMFQNHMFQLLASFAMEPPVKFNSEQYRDEKAKVLRALKPVAHDQLDDYVVRAQYADGVIDEDKVPGYLSEEGVPSESCTETFVAMKLFIDNWRWDGVPFYLRAGKRMNCQSTEVTIQFKEIPHSMFSAFSREAFSPNILCFRINPDEGISLKFEAKQPGPDLQLASIKFDFDYKNTFQESLMGPYERLLLDCMHGDQALFIREDMVDLSWEFITSILKEWEHQPGRSLAAYPSGSWGPHEANQLIKKDGRHWRAYGPNISSPINRNGKEL